MEDFPLQQSHDKTLYSAFDQVIKITGHMVHPDTALAYLNFVLIRHRLYWVNCNSRTEEEHTQLLVL